MEDNNSSDFCQEDSNTPDFYYNEGVYNYEEGQYELSVENFKKAIELNASVFEYYFNLGITYIKLEQYDSAIETLKKALPLNSRDTDIYINLGTAFYIKGDFNNAAKAYKKAAFMNSGDPENCNYAGIGCCALKNFKEAIGYFRLAVKVEPRNDNYNYNLAQAYYECEKYDLAEECLVNVSRFNKQNEDVYFLLGKIYLKQNDDCLAQDSFETTLRINPEHKEAEAELEKIIARKASRSQNKSVKPANPLSESDIEVSIQNNLNSVRVLIEKKEYDSACIELEKIIKLIKSRPQAASQFKM